MPPQLDENKPLYLQVRERLEDMIVKGQLKEGEQAPSTTQLASFYQINHITVGKGVNQLVEEGILFKKRGIGMFVAEGAKETLLQRRRKTFGEEFVRPMIVEAKKLGLTVTDLMQFIQEEERGEEHE